MSLTQRSSLTDREIAEHTGYAHEPAHAPDGTGHATPAARLIALLSANRSDLTTLLIYTVLTGLLALAVPLAVQSLVNTIAAGLFLQPLVVLTCLVLVGLLALAALRVLQLSLVEILQQRVFANVALQLAEQLPRVRNTALANEYAPELVNRFFDVLTIQKTLAKILLDGLAAALQASVGLALMAFYSPILLAFDVFVLLFVAFVFGILGWGGLRTSIRESVHKYRVAEWLEELGRCQTGFKMNGRAGYLLERADRLVVNYIVARRAHFRVILRQAVGNYVFQAVASAGLLGIGGWLVINRQLTLGQLVAAELIVASVLASIEKLARQSEPLFDLLTGLDKIGHVTDLEVERIDGSELPTGEGGLTVTCRGARFGYRTQGDVLADVYLCLEAGSRVSLVGKSGAGKSTLAALLCGLEEPEQGVIEIGGVEARSLSLASLRHAVALVNDANEIFDGTLEENIVVGRTGVTREDIRQALELTQLTEDIARLPQGLQTPLVSGGRNLSRGQMQRLLIARAVVARPRLLILDEAFTGIDEQAKLRILDAIFAPERAWTIINISHDAEVVQHSQQAYVLAEGRIVEHGRPQELLQRPGSAFVALFPDMASRWVNDAPPPLPRVFPSPRRARAGATSLA